MNGKFNIQIMLWKHLESIWKFQELCTVFFWKRCEECGTKKVKQFECKLKQKIFFSNTFYINKFVYIERFHRRNHSSLGMK
jgi:hypothetical protein